MKIVRSDSHIELKDIEENSVQTFTFNLEKAIPGLTVNNFRKYKPSCGCMATKLSYPTLFVEFTASQIPLHLRPGKILKFKKHIRVTLQDGSEELLHITGNLKI